MHWYVGIVTPKYTTQFNLTLGDGDVANALPFTRESDRTQQIAIGRK